MSESLPPSAESSLVRSDRVEVSLDLPLASHPSSLARQGGMAASIPRSGERSKIVRTPTASRQLLTAERLAAALPGKSHRGARSPGYVSAMKAAGYVFSHGPYTTLPHALNWLRENPDFRTTRYRNRVPGFEGKKARRPRREVSSAGTAGEPTRCCG